MRILPVIDLLAGEVVRGVGGRRREYRPIVSRLTPSSRPADVAHAFRTHFGLAELYLADLDAIGGGEPARPVYDALAAEGFGLWVDAGVRTVGRVDALAAAGVESIVLGLETLAGPRALAEACERYGERIAFSLDLRGGVPLGDAAAWEASDPAEIAARAAALGVRRMIVLDLAQVGVGGGVGTEALCRRLAGAHPAVELLAGGGVRGADDLRRLKGCGVRGVLVASALHDGRLTRADWERL